MSSGEFETMDRGDGIRLAFQHVTSPGPIPVKPPTATLIWLPGFASDMSGTKAETLAAWAVTGGHRFLRLDYSGTGRSEGRFESGTIGRWSADALAVIGAKTRGPLVLAGSSMGAWIALLIARALPGRVKALLLIAPAPDFTERLLWPSLSPKQQRQILADGVWPRPSPYGDPIPITRALIEDGKKHLVMDAPIHFDGPVRILQGSQDEEVPWSHVVDLAAALSSDNKVISKLEGGDHRLSRPEDLERLLEHAEALMHQAARATSPD